MANSINGDKAVRCKQCGGPLPAATGAGRPRLFCSLKCKQRKWMEDNPRVSRQALDQLVGGAK